MAFGISPRTAEWDAWVTQDALAEGRSRWGEPEPAPAPASALTTAPAVESSVAPLPSPVNGGFPAWVLPLTVAGLAVAWWWWKR